jgi:hypothetical protein
MVKRKTKNGGPLLPGVSLGQNRKKKAKLKKGKKTFI